MLAKGSRASYLNTNVKVRGGGFVINWSRVLLLVLLMVMMMMTTGGCFVLNHGHDDDDDTRPKAP